jgi:hypothetical protein
VRSFAKKALATASAFSILRKRDGLETTSFLGFDERETSVPSLQGAFLHPQNKNLQKTS